MNTFNEDLENAQLEVVAREGATDNPRYIIEAAIEAYDAVNYRHFRTPLTLGEGGNDAKLLARFIGRCLDNSGYQLTRTNPPA